MSFQIVPEFTSLEVPGLLTECSDFLPDQLAVPGSPWKNDLRRKYLSQVDILLQDAEYFKVTCVCW